MKIEDINNVLDFTLFLDGYFDKTLRGREEQIKEFLSGINPDGETLQKIARRFRSDYTQATYPACGVIEKITTDVTAYSSSKSKFKPRHEVIKYITDTRRNYGPRQVYKLCKHIRKDLYAYNTNALAMSILWVFDDLEHNADARRDAGMEPDVIGELARQDFDALIAGEEVEDAARGLTPVNQKERSNRTLSIDELVEDVFPPLSKQ